MWVGGVTHLYRHGGPHPREGSGRVSDDPRWWAFHRSRGDEGSKERAFRIEGARVGGERNVFVSKVRDGFAHSGG